MSLPLFISNSGGRTSALMTLILLEYFKDREKVVMFANTGKEQEETLNFIRRCDDELNFNTVWVEAVINPTKGKGTRHKVISYETASRNGEPFEEMIKKYGIPNSAFPHCTRELKSNPMHNYVRRELGWKRYETAIGIRTDEQHRINRAVAEKNLWIYPLTDLIPIAKEIVNEYWGKQNFTLELEEFEGNCDFCWKKSDRKLVQNIIKRPEKFQWWIDKDDKYSTLKIEGRKPLLDETHFYRGNRSSRSLLEVAQEVLSDQSRLETLSTQEKGCFCKSTD